ncbi:MAG: ABC transporter permease [Lachnospiraceae bacterium]|nr:ABC transporter permease [Lachnospiraceae bacterium]
MTFYYSIKQMRRSPLKSLLFFLLIGLCAFFLALGGALWYMGSSGFQNFDELYTTIGTVEQKYEGTKVVSRWDPERQSYEYYSGGYYGEWLKDDVLDFGGADYILKPRQRPYFGAYIEDLYNGIGSPDMGVVEAAPLETGPIYPSFPMRVVRVLEGTMQEGDIFYLCDHQSEDPAILEAGKTYVMQLSMFGMTHGPNAPDGEQVLEYQLSSGIASTQYTIDMEPVYDPVTEEERWYDEVTDGFYETERGKRWLALSSYQDYSMRTIPVQPVDGTELLMHFYNGEAQITEGRDITEKEYTEGAKVCLIPEKLAMQLGKKTGDTLTLPLYYADYSRPVGDAFMLGARGHASVNILNAEGSVYPVFNEQEYEIVGLYTAEDEGSGSYTAGENEVVIPWKAIPENCWKDNIAGAGPMKGANTSFQIPNGTVEEFQEAWEALGIDDLEIRFYDMGYTQLKDSLENRQLMSVIFLFSGGVMAVLILCFFSSLFITGQKERIAVERLMGRTKRQCAVSILAGMLVLSVAGCAAGSAFGWLATGKAVEGVSDTLEFDRMYSDNVIANTNPEETGEQPGAALPCVTGGVLLAVSAAISAGYMGKVLRKEPLRMLGEIEE